MVINMKTTIGEIRQVIREIAETVKPKRVPRWQQEIQNKWEKLKTTVSSTRRELDSALERADVAINAIEDRKDQSALILVLQ